MNHTNKALEVALYTIANPDKFDTLQRQAHEHISASPGFVQGLALRGSKKPTHRADIMLWHSPGEATNAASALRQDERFAEFGQAIEDLTHFHHYSPTLSRDALERTTPLIEIAIHTPRDGAASRMLQRDLHRVLFAVEGATPMLLAEARDTKGSLLLLDLIGWQNEVTHDAGPAAILEQAPTLQAFFDGMETVHAFELFEEVGV